MQVAIVKYNAGNVSSVVNALRRLGVEPLVTADPESIKKADRVIFPGVGEASSTMQHLRAAGLDTCIKALVQPVLGICLGMQLLCTFSEENQTECLGLFSQHVKRFEQQSCANGRLKVPQIGWNQVYNCKGPLFAGISEGACFYFVHSYYAELGEATIARTEYDVEFSSALCQGNFFGVQFHPEKSAAVGAQLLTNFLNIAE